MLVDRLTPHLLVFVEPGSNLDTFILQSLATNRNVYEPADSLIFRKVSKIVRLAMKPPRHRVAPCSTMDVLFSCCLWSAGGVSAMKGRRFKQGVRSFMVDVLASVQKTLRSCTSCHRQSSSIFINYLSINRSIDLSINICIYIYT